MTFPSMGSAKQRPGNVTVITEQQQIEAPQKHLILPTPFVAIITPTKTTFSVLNIEKLICANTGAVTITNFTNGQAGQEISILGDGHTSVANNASIKTASGGTTLLAANKTYRFTAFPIDITKPDIVWYQDG